MINFQNGEIDLLTYEIFKVKINPFETPHTPFSILFYSQRLILFSRCFNIFPVSSSFSLGLLMAYLSESTQLKLESYQDV